MAAGGKEALRTKSAGFHQIMSVSFKQIQVCCLYEFQMQPTPLLAIENGTRAPVALNEEAIEASRRKFRTEILSGQDGFLNKEADHIAKLLQTANEYLPLLEEKNA